MVECGKQYIEIRKAEGNWRKERKQQEEENEQRTSNAQGQRSKQHATGCMLLMLLRGFHKLASHHNNWVCMSQHWHEKRLQQEYLNPSRWFVNLEKKTRKSVWQMLIPKILCNKRNTHFTLYSINLHKQIVRNCPRKKSGKCKFCGISEITKKKKNHNNDNMQQQQQQTLLISS